MKRCNIVRIKSSQADPLDRAQMVRESLAKIDPTTDVLEVGPGVFDFGNVEGGVYFRPGQRVYGDGPDNTLWTSSWLYQQQCQFELNDGVSLNGMRLRNIRKNRFGDAGVLIGFSQTTWSQARGVKPTPNPTAELNDVVCDDAGEYCKYIWGQAGARIISRRCSFAAGKVAVCAGQASGGTASCFIDMYDCKILLDTSLGAPGGASGLVGAGILGRGGLTRMFGGSITVVANRVPNDDPKNPKTLQQAAGAWLGMVDHNDQDPSKSNYGKATWAAIELHSVNVSCAGFDGLDLCDLRELIAPYPKYDPQKCGSLCAYRGSGSGPGGKFITKGDVFVDQSRPFNVA